MSTRLHFRLSGPASPAQSPATMWTRNVLPIGLCLQTVAAIPFVTNAITGVSYQGTSADGIEQFQNIFYAEDTSGANRFAPPVPYTPKRGSTVQATAGGLPCPQSFTGNANYPFDSPITNISEDCLSLRIARPANQSSEKPLPVMVWHYGGVVHLLPCSPFSHIADVVSQVAGWLEKHTIGSIIP